MKKALFIILIALSIFTLQAQEATWTIVDCENPGKLYQEQVNYYYADRRLKERLGRLWPGTKVEPLQFSEGSYNVRFNNGQIAWISYLNIKEASEMEITTDAKMYAVDLNKKILMDKVIENLEKGDIVSRTGMGDEGEFYAKTKNGKRGAIFTNYADPVTDKLIKEYNRAAEKEFYFKEDLDDLVLNKNDSVLTKTLGDPHALVFNLIQKTWYYPQIEVFQDGLRYKGIVFSVKNNIVDSYELQGEGASSFVDKLPLYLSFKKNNKLNFMDKAPEVTLFRGIKERPVIIRILLRILQFILIFIVFSFGRILAFQILKIFALIRPLSNLIVKLIGFVLNLVFNYVYFIYIITHLITEDFGFTAIVMSVMLVLGHRKINNRINYHRCPQCHMMWTAIDKGSAVVGKTHKTEHKTDTRLTNQYTNSSGQRVNEYTRFHWQEHMTEKQIQDHRYCDNCGFRWDVERTETVKGHV